MMNLALVQFAGISWLCFVEESEMNCTLNGVSGAMAFAMPRAAYDILVTEGKTVYKLKAGDCLSLGGVVGELREDGLYCYNLRVDITQFKEAVLYDEKKQERESKVPLPKKSSGKVRSASHAA